MTRNFKEITLKSLLASKVDYRPSVQSRQANIKLVHPLIFILLAGKLVAILNFVSQFGFEAILFVFYFDRLSTNFFGGHFEFCWQFEIVPYVGLNPEHNNPAGSVINNLK